MAENCSFLFSLTSNLFIFYKYDTPFAELSSILCANWMQMNLMNFYAKLCTLIS